MANENQAILAHAEDLDEHVEGSNANSHGIGRRCCRYMLSELHYSSLCCCYKDNKAFLFSPWLPYKWRYQWLYVLYRWVIMLYFLAWLIIVSVAAGQNPAFQAKFLIYLTNWCFLFFNAYLLMAAVSVTVSAYYYQANQLSAAVPSLTNKKEEQRIKCSLLSFVTGAHWALGILGLEFAVAVTVLFWIFFNDPALYSVTLSISSIHVHMLNGIIAFLDMWISGIPFRPLHFVYVVLFGCAYVVFSGVYYAAQGTDVNDNPYIYPILNYEDNPGLAAGVAIGCGLVFTTLLHFIFYLMYLVRYWLSRLLQTKVYGPCFESSGHEAETVALEDGTV